LWKDTLVLVFLLKGKHARKEVMAFIPCLIKKFKWRSKSGTVSEIGDTGTGDQCRTKYLGKELEQAQMQKASPIF
jgi:hypothetical protein